MCNAVLLCLHAAPLLLRTERALDRSSSVILQNKTRASYRIWHDPDVQGDIWPGGIWSQVVDCDDVLLLSPEAANMQITWGCKLIHEEFICLYVGLPCYSWSRSWSGVKMHIRSYIMCPCAVFFTPVAVVMVPWQSAHSWSEKSLFSSFSKLILDMSLCGEGWRSALLVQWLISSLVNAPILLAGLVTCYIW